MFNVFLSSLFAMQLLLPPGHRPTSNLSTVRKKMVAVHFTSIPGEPNTANKRTESHSFCEIRPCANSIVYARFEVFRTFLCVVLSVFRIFVHY